MVMKTGNFPKLFFLFLLLTLYCSITNAASAATNLSDDPIQVFRVLQQDIDGDRLPDVTIIDCAFATQYDRVFVYDQNGDMSIGNRWQDTTDFSDDVWIFDVGADDTAQLIVDFNIEDGRYVAMVYDDLNGDGRVNYRVQEGQIIIEESDFWHVKVISEQRWSQIVEGIDTSLRFLIDGFDGLGFALHAGKVNQNNGIDGNTDWEIDVGDKNGDGVIDYLLQRVVSQELIQAWNPGLYKAHIRYQSTGRPPQPYDNAIFWPLLIGSAEVKGRYFDHIPTIAIDWKTGTIFQLGVLGYPIEAGYHILSRLPLEKNTLNAVDFENPMAYYDMAEDQDGQPELQVRFEVEVPGSPYLLYPLKVETPNIEVDYSWDQDNDGRWDYKMSLSANDAITEITKFPDFSIKSVPYKEIVPWVLAHIWDVAVFVFDGQPTGDSEGMYARGWMINRGFHEGRSIVSGLKRDYLMGFSDQPPVENFQDIQKFMRGEYSFKYFDTPKIYLSALDRQLHLLGAQSGVWNLGDRHYIRYANLDNDAYLDQWQEERDDMVIQQMNYSHDIYIYYGYDLVRLKQVNDSSPALVETQPPGNYEEWQRLNAQLNANRLDVSPEDFSAMLDHLDGVAVQIQGASIQDYRITSQGFRFILELQPGFSVNSSLEASIVLPESPGSYVIEYDGAEWTVKPATPAALHISELQVDGPPNTLRALDWTTVETVIENTGLEDAHDVPLCILFDGPTENTVVMTDTVSLIPGEGKITKMWHWAPSHTGDWHVRLLADCDGSEKSIRRGTIIAEDQFHVQEKMGPSSQWLLSLGGMVPSGMVVAFWGIAAMLAGAVSLAWLRRS